MGVSEGYHTATRGDSAVCYRSEHGLKSATGTSLAPYLNDSDSRFNQLWAAV